jgi:hypothetical protein
MWRDGIGSVEGGRRSCHVMSALVCGLDVHKDLTIRAKISFCVV